MDIQGTREELASQGLSGNVLNEKLYNQTFDIELLKTDLKYNRACFVAGTLVHTDKGLVPIQDIKVGDMVLSRDEFNPQGDLQYKPVLSTFKSQQKERIYKVEYPTNDGMEYISVTHFTHFGLPMILVEKQESGKPQRTCLGHS